MAEIAAAKTVLVIAGPTAVGKTALSIEVAEAAGTGILSADSRQCYQGMAIGTAQPGAEELARVPHHFINELLVEDHFSAARYESYGLEVINQIFRKQDVAVVCGGTGLYLKALCEGLDETPEVDPAIAADVDTTYKTEGLSWLQARVREEDPAGYASVDAQNPARLLRILAFVRTTGHSLTKYQKRSPKTRSFRIVKYALELPRPLLYSRIEQRVDAMMDAGLLAEAQALYPKRHLKALQTVGYAELFEYFDGKWSLDEAVSKIKQHTRNYAKRQMTWFRNEGSYLPLAADDPDAVAIMLAAVRT